MRKTILNRLLQLILLILLILFPPLTYAVSDPLVVPNNKFGLHIISSSPDEIKDTSSMVNTNGDWGYITFLIESSQRDQSRWQTFFNELRRHHLIPIVRLATKPAGGTWVRPYEKEAEAWADFLDKLNWPTKNRYIVIYNEPNHATEWGGSVDPENYAKTLSETIDVLKHKNPDFFVINAGLDAASPNKMPAYMDSFTFMEKMDEAVPGIFNKLDGWSSHSYPNPNFSGSPSAGGKMSIKGFEEELKKLKTLHIDKTLPVFITETGWKHSEGKNGSSNFPSAQTVAEYYETAFTTAWDNPQIVMVAPFILDYQEPPFDNFSFKKIRQVIDRSPNPNEEANQFYPAFTTLKNLPKTTGQPVQLNSAKLIKGGLSTQKFTSTFEASQSSVSTSLVAGQTYDLFLSVENNGQSIWNDSGQIALAPFSQSSELGIIPMKIPADQKIEPGQSYTFHITIKAPVGGDYKVQLNMYNGEKLFDSDPFEFIVNIKSPVLLQVHSELKWKKNPAGDYILTVFGEVKNAVNRTINALNVGNEGNSETLEAKYLLPDQDYNFTLEKPFYKPVTIHQTVSEGVNQLDFGELQPDIGSAILNPTELWKLLPWSE